MEKLVSLNPKISSTEFVPRGKDKDTVVALREIAAGHVTIDNIALLHRVGESHDHNAMF